MMHTVEKIGGTSMSAFDAVLDNIMFYPQSPYQRIFVVSAYGGITDALLECKRSGEPGIYQHIADRNAIWKEKLDDLKQRMLLINDNIFADPLCRKRADKFVTDRLSQARDCIDNILETCQFKQFSLSAYLPQIREFLSSIGEAHSAFNTVLKLKKHGVNARFVDLSGWDDKPAGSLDDVITQAMSDIDLSKELPIVTGYVYCDEGLMKTYDRGYSEMTFSRLAVLTQAKQAVIHKEYHLSTADPRIVGPDVVMPMGISNYDVADQLANLGMEAIHPNAASGLRRAEIQLVVKNTFEPEHKGTWITPDHQPETQKVEIIAGRDKVFALNIFDQSMVGKADNIGYDLMQIIRNERVQLIGKEMNANSITYYLAGSSTSHNRVLTQAEQMLPDAQITGNMVALISAIGACIDTNEVLRSGMSGLMAQNITPKAAHSSLRNVDVQFVVADEDYAVTIRTLHETLIANQSGRKQKKSLAA
ncbi:aspartate kinase [Photobacterium sp. TY1-4]|uniref:aspartate kinase n=1 Tax=Photobacterium sp. TY1-4 TaxID=2899122 RepID=UPI0021BF2B27|nr:aspartate kinase [Photobacterium sp. TY1-4]UXI04642.1 aspartate kinase [Photobacterium sp. TY1-4]